MIRKIFLKMLEVLTEIDKNFEKILVEQQKQLILFTYKTKNFENCISLLEESKKLSVYKQNFKDHAFLIQKAKILKKTN